MRLYYWIWYWDIKSMDTWAEIGISLKQNQNLSLRRNVYDDVAFNTIPIHNLQSINDNGTEGYHVVNSLRALFQSTPKKHQSWRSRAGTKCNRPRVGDAYGYAREMTTRQRWNRYNISAAHVSIAHEHCRCHNESPLIWLRRHYGSFYYREGKNAVSWKRSFFKSPPK